MQEELISINGWEINNENKSFINIINNKLVVNNTSNKKIKIDCLKKIKINDENIKNCYVKFEGKVENSGGYISINQVSNIPINSESVIPLKTPTILNLSLYVSAKSKIEICDFKLIYNYEENLVDTLNKKSKVLIISPDYPSYANLYSCAFAHSRNKEYEKSGLDIQVFAISWFQTKYKRNNIPVLKGTYEDLKKLLSKHQYDVIVTHFVDENLYPIFDGNIYNNQKLIFICHGPETVYRYLVNKTRPYFTAPMKEPIISNAFDLKDKYVKIYSQKDNVEWIFVSDWLKEFSEQEQNLKFKHSQVINNIIDEDLFPYSQKNADDRKKILMVRKFDDICQHSIDQVVYAILELSRKEIFKELEFDIYGDGNYYDELVEPIKHFDNVHLYRKFIPNEDLNEVYKTHGIMLLPSRHDAHAVSMGEAASTGLVVLGSRVTSNPYFMNEKENHTLADPENFKELANIIERLYNNPEEFLKISKNMSVFTRQFKKENTVNKEIKLIKDSLNEVKKKVPFIISKKPLKNPILTIGIPAYNLEDYIEKCLISILNARNSHKIEVLVINDGSKDNTAKIVKEYEKLSNGIVRLIDKENGGHGSTINRAIIEAKGKYFRLIDGDDWVDSENLAKLVDIMENNDSDIILTKGSYDYKEEAQLVDIIKYDNLNEGTVYNFEDLVYDSYGFKTYGPLLTTGNYKLEILKKANFKITEKKPYVDMEFNAFSIKCVNTITYYNLDIYRYLIGREGQTISSDYWKKKYKDHQYIIFNILDNVYSNNDYSINKRKYILKNIISQMVDSQIYMFDAICKQNEIDTFLEKLKNYPEAYEYSMNEIKNKNGNCWLILNCYRKFINKNESIIIPGYRENINDINKVKKSTLKKIIKAIIPYGLLYAYRKHNNKN